MEPLLSSSTLLICFGGGVFGAAIGGLFSFIFCGFLVFSGCLMVLGGGSDFLLLQVGLGPIFGVYAGGFTSGIVASTYAAGVRKNHPSGAAKDILSPLIDTSWDVLAVGGATAVIAHLLLQGLKEVPIINMFDCLALTIALMILAARLLFQREMPWGNMASIKEHGWLGTNDYAISWVPWMLPLPKMGIYGLGVGLLSGAMAMGTKQILDPMVANGVVPEVNAFVVPLVIAWSMAAISILGLNFATGSIQKFPVWHGQALIAALTFLFFDSLLLAGIAGALGAYLQELMARMFYNHGSNHADPPAFAIAVGTLILNGLNNFVG